MGEGEEKKRREEKREERKRKEKKGKKGKEKNLDVGKVRTLDRDKERKEEGWAIRWLS